MPEEPVEPEPDKPDTSSVDEELEALPDVDSPTPDSMVDDRNDGIRVALPTTETVLRRFAALGAQEAFRIDPSELAKIEFPTNVVKEWSPPQRLAELLSASVADSLRTPDWVFKRLQLSDAFWNTARLLQSSTSVAELYPPEQLKSALLERQTLAPRDDRTPAAFFGEHEVEIGNVRDLLKALSTVQWKQREHRPMWRGQQDATWGVHSSLYRRIDNETTVDEDRLVGAERGALDAAAQWGTGTRKALDFLAKLQHHGAPTRLLDSTVDPEIAAWFAVEEHPKLDESDGLVLGWGRAPRIRGGVPASAEKLPRSEDEPFWHAWTTDEERRRVDWGTGTKTWAWMPPALNDRMRAQRAGFLIEAGPILTDDIVDVFSTVLSQDWRASEISRATSIVGLPSRHDVLTKPNPANLVPLFAFRIVAKAKPEIREYLEGKGLAFSTVYPDLGGLVDYLKGPFGPK